VQDTGRLFADVLAGAPGFEPGDGGTKNRCLTTWLRPIRADDESETPPYRQRAARVQSGRGLLRCGMDERAVARIRREPVCSMTNRMLVDGPTITATRQIDLASYSPQTANSLPAGSAKWNLRPPGNA
jgi:hypothetical protein